jgi:hypothetical protein
MVRYGFDDERQNFVLGFVQAQWTSAKQILLEIRCANHLGTGRFGYWTLHRVASCLTLLAAKGLVQYEQRMMRFATGWHYGRVWRRKQ